MNRQIVFAVLASIFIGSWNFTATRAQADSNDQELEQGKIAYQQCSVCHQPSGLGTPGLFPPIAGRIASMASTEQGRAYLVRVISKGLMGSINVDGTLYFGTMPGFDTSMDNADISSVLNYVALSLSLKSEPDFRLFTEDEVTALKEKHPKASVSNNLAFRKKLLADVPSLQ